MKHCVIKLRAAWIVVCLIVMIQQAVQSITKSQTGMILFITMIGIRRSRTCIRPITSLILQDVFAPHPARKHVRSILKIFLLRSKPSNMRSPIKHTNLAISRHNLLRKRRVKKLRSLAQVLQAWQRHSN